MRRRRSNKPWRCKRQPMPVPAKRCSCLRASSLTPPTSSGQTTLRLLPWRQSPCEVSLLLRHDGVTIFLVVSRACLTMKSFRFCSPTLTWCFCSRFLRTRCTPGPSSPCPPPPPPPPPSSPALSPSRAGKHAEPCSTACTREVLYPRGHRCTYGFFA